MNWDNGNANDDDDVVGGPNTEPVVFRDVTYGPGGAGIDEFHRTPAGPNPSDRLIEVVNTLFNKAHKQDSDFELETYLRRNKKVLEIDNAEADFFYRVMQEIKNSKAYTDNDFDRVKSVVDVVFSRQSAADALGSSLCLLDKVLSRIESCG